VTIPISISSFTPTSIGTTGGAEITITGLGFPSE